MSTSRITLDYALATAQGCQGGLAESAMKTAATEFPSAVSGVMARVDSGELGFWRAPADGSSLQAMEAFAKGVAPSITDILVLGIGGSSLGTRAIFQALAGPPELTFARPGRRVHLPDNSDPWFLTALLPHLSPKTTLVLAVSKSGGTVETAAQLLVLKEWLAKDLGETGLQKHLAVVTDPEKGALRAFARTHGLAAFDVPSNIGGRFSVLTPVGLLPALLAGLDVAAMMRGAAEMATRCESKDLSKNPAGMIAVLHALHHRAGRPIHVLMPYADALRSFTAWYVQIWAESLGKRLSKTGERIEVGPTPLPAIGATDQHAQVQLFMEGPRDKLLTFVRIGKPLRDVTIPKAEGEYGYLGGHSLAGLLDVELRGTALALARDGRPSLTVNVDTLDAHNLGALFFLYEAATAIAGELYGINAFDQPGVEEGKRLAFGLLGRAGFEAAKREVEESEQTRPASLRVG